MDFTSAFFVGVVGAWLIFSVSLAAHEAGHALALRHFHLPIEEISIGWLGVFAFRYRGTIFRIGCLPVFALTKSGEFAKASPSIRACIAVAGPFASTILGLLMLVVSEFLMQDIWSLVARLNLALALFNLVPLPPMDGWPIAKWLLSSKFGIVFSPQQEKTLHTIGIIFIALAIVLAMPSSNA